jgi:hypothetical protein
MSMTRWLGATLAAVSLLVAGCEDLEQEVRDTYHQYMAALENDDADAVLAMTDPQYVEHLDYVARKARTADREAVMRLTPAERVSLVRMRNRLTKAELQALDGKAWLMRTVKEGWRIDEILDAYELADITIKRPRAYGTMEIAGFASPFKMEFVKTGDRWLLDPIAVEQVINDYLTKKYSPQAEEQFIRAREGMRTDTTVRASIWDVPK